jgi:hypothetical protein
MFDNHGLKTDPMTFGYFGSDCIKMIIVVLNYLETGK